MRVSKMGLKGVGLALALLAGASPASSAFALPEYEIRTLYYADENMTHVVGGTLSACNGHYSSWGTETLFWETTLEPCV